MIPCPDYLAKRRPQIRPALLAVFARRLAEGEVVFMPMLPMPVQAALPQGPAEAISDPEAA